ncbi:hypothetical protein HYALB_00007234 [Hymenoscyphus albidus]|uniref:Uncharacterized protein n=1 Tax=Hymenoscyphus albidus TaxID=595503 RepID=A0A9N9LCU9_9HELO|nr:hypothetical protein HYALB_00007234 [Hymenoscyphus albidus]
MDLDGLDPSELEAALQHYLTHIIEKNLGKSPNPGLPLDPSNRKLDLELISKDPAKIHEFWKSVVLQTSGTLTLEDESVLFKKLHSIFMKRVDERRAEVNRCRTEISELEFSLQVLRQVDKIYLDPKSESKMKGDGKNFERVFDKIKKDIKTKQEYYAKERPTIEAIIPVVDGELEEKIKDHKTHLKTLVTPAL